MYNRSPKHSCEDTSNVGGCDYEMGEKNPVLLSWEFGLKTWIWRQILIVSYCHSSGCELILQALSFPNKWKVLCHHKFAKINLKWLFSFTLAICVTREESCMISLLSNRYWQMRRKWRIHLLFWVLSMTIKR